MKAPETNPQNTAKRMVPSRFLTAGKVKVTAPVKNVNTTMRLEIPNLCEMALGTSRPMTLHALRMGSYRTRQVSHTFYQG
jgi:hypothetical protein